jgi:hypothetical protein
VDEVWPNTTLCGDGSAETLRSAQVRAYCEGLTNSSMFEPRSRESPGFFHSRSSRARNRSSRKLERLRHSCVDNYVLHLDADGFKHRLVELADLSVSRADRPLRIEMPEPGLCTG